MEIPGHLYIVATPIGNMQDITLRALEVLRDCDSVVCEDTRITGNLLHHYNVQKPMRALNEYNEDAQIYDILSELQHGAKIALVSDNGTPLISDPGFLLVRAAREKEIQVTPIPGPSAVTAALSASGLPTDSFLFMGFLSKNNTKKTKVLTHIRETISKDFSPTLIMYESPHRIIQTLSTLLEVFGDRNIVVARELTKIYEEFKFELLSKLIAEYSEKKPKGEITLVMSLKS